MRAPIRRKGWLSALPLLCIVLVTVSCTDLTAVREWSKTSLEASRYDEIVTTYAGTPERLKRYDPSRHWDDQAALRKKQAKALREILAVVSDYMASLATLSADSTVDYDKDVKTLTASIGKLNAGISANTLGAVGSLVKDVLEASAKAYRAKQVAKVVQQANNPIQVILHGDLREIVDKDFRNDLKIEQRLIDRYYDKLKQTGNPSPAAIAAVSEWKELRIEQNTARVKALEAYLMVLDKIAEGHQKLYDNRNNLEAKTLIRELSSLVAELRKQITILAKSSNLGGN